MSKNTHYFYFPNENDTTKFEEVSAEQAQYRGTPTEVLVAVKTEIGKEGVETSAHIMFDYEDGAVIADEAVFSSDCTVEPIKMARGVIAGHLASCLDPN
jgi:hypothetical protein